MRDNAVAYVRQLVEAAPQSGHMPPRPPIHADGWHDIAPLIAVRTQLGITQSVLAVACGLSQPLVSRIERGFRAVTPDLLDVYWRGLVRCVEAGVGHGADEAVNG